MNDRRNQTMTKETAEREARDAQARDAEMRDQAKRESSTTAGPTGGSETPTQRPNEAMSTAAMAEAMDRRGNGGQGTEATARADRTGAEPHGSDSTRSTPLFSSDESDRFHARWIEMQMGFVDEPRQSVEKADALVAEVIQRLAQVFAEERGKLEQQWSKGGDVDTEALRIALQRYRSFFERLLTT